MTMLAVEQRYSRIAEPVLRWSTHSPDAPAISGENVTWTFSDLRDAVEEAAAFLSRHDVVRGDRVMLIGENGPALAAFILGCGLIDTCAVLENARRASHEVDTILRHCNPRLIIYLGSDSTDAAMHAERHGATATRLMTIGTILFSQATPPSLPDAVDGTARDTAVLIYTTGTTGSPKGVMLSHANLLYLSEMMCQLRELVSSDRVYGVLPITHVMGLAGAMCGTLRAGAHLFLVSRFSAPECLNALANHRITILQGAPAMFSKLVQYGRSVQETGNSLRFISAGGAPIDPKVKADTEAFLGLTLHNGYGLTEGAGLCWTRLNQPRKDCSVGLPLPGVELKLLDIDKREVAAGTVGELWARGPSVMKGYYRDDSLTKQSIRPGGWFNTQDLAQIDNDGYVSIVGRTKDLIIVSGFNVRPLEIEEALNAHDKVSSSAVIGRKADGNEEIVAFVEPVKGACISPDELRFFIRNRLSPYKRPREIYLIDNLPTSPNGKVLKSRLQSLIADNTNTDAERILKGDSNG